MKAEYPYNFAPEAITCMRGRAKDMTWDAELRFDGTHYVVGTGFKTPALAKKTAQLRVDALLVNLRNAGATFLVQFPKAKP